MKSPKKLRRPASRTLIKPRETGGSERTREELLRAARMLFSRKGFAATTVKEIADKAGVNISLISYHFGGKEGLFQACLNSFAVKRREVALRILRSPLNATEFRARLMQFFEEMVGLFLQEKEMTVIIHCDLDLDVPVVEEIFRETMLPIFQTTVEFMTAAKTNGVMREDKDPVIAAGLFFGSMVHAMRSEPAAKKFFNRSLTDTEYRERLQTTLVSIFCDGLLIKE